jgi:Asp-tRNA(Asn)/Glu-tRNA(Gln) amidotransferase A subunit family amidase
MEPAVRLLEMLRARDVSARELAEAHIAQIERLNPQLNAFADFDAERVRERAREMDAVAMEARGPLHGLPVTVKSSIATAGYKCEIGSLNHKDEIPGEDAVVVARLRAAGALILGTTNCPEFLMAYETDNMLHGQTRNPWDLERTPGGSSGGESAAIAAGMSAAGLGSDSGGSVRVPAHFTGICSLKPTPGRIPGRGHLPSCVGPFATLGAIGPMARTMADVELMFRTLSGQDDADPASPPVTLRAFSDKELRKNRIGFFEDDGLTPVTAETRIAVRKAAAVLREAGYCVEPFQPRTLEQLRKLWWTFFVQCGAMFYEPEVRGGRKNLSPIFREFLEIAERTGPLSATDLLNAWAELDLLRAKTLEEMREYPALLCPVASVPAWKHGERKRIIDGQAVEYLDAVKYTQWFNTLGAPAAVVPVGHSAEGLPIGVQIVARPFEDEVALGVAGIVDRAFGFSAPAMAARG